MGHVTKSSTIYVFLLTWIVFQFISSTNGQGIELRLQERVFVAFKGENINISFHLKKPLNESDVIVKCFDPQDKIIQYIRTSEIDDSISINNVTLSGEYYCQCQTVYASWFVRVRESGFKEAAWGYSETEVITVSIVTSLLLIFSVGGSIYVFKEHWGCCKTQSNTQNSDVRQEETEHNTNGEPAQSTSFYSSLEARPRSVYDVLDHSAAASAEDKTKGKSRQTPQKQDEGVFESVYENF